MDTGGMIPLAGLYDVNENVVGSEVLVNGFGEYMIQSDEILPETEYFIHISADDFLAFNSGSYELTVSYSDQVVQYDQFAAGSMGGRMTGNLSGRKFHSLHIAEAQLFQFAFEADQMRGGRTGFLWVTVYDENDLIVYRGATRDGERRTSNAAYFSPGSYTVKVEFDPTSPRYGLARLNYRLLGINIGDSQGPEFNDPSDSPFVRNGNGEYEYPDDVLSSAGYVFVNGISSGQDPPPNDDPPMDIYRWYWLGV